MSSLITNQVPEADRISRNETRYSSQGILAIRDWVEMWVQSSDFDLGTTNHLTKHFTRAKQALSHWSVGNPRHHRLDGTFNAPFSVKYWTVPEEYSNYYARQKTFDGNTYVGLRNLQVKGLVGKAWGSWRAVSFRPGGVECTNLCLPSPGKVKKSDLEALAERAVGVEPSLSREIVGQIAVFFYLKGHIAWEAQRYMTASMWERIVNQLEIDAARSGLTVKVLKRRVNPSKPARTKEEKIEGYLEHLGDTSQPMEGSSRTWRGQWTLSPIEDYYTREWQRREAWAEKIRALGEDVDSHESFPDYLRRCADELERCRVTYRGGNKQPLWRKG